MTGMLTAVTIIVGVPLCLLAVVSAVLEAPYLIVPLVWLGVLVRRGCRRAGERFRRDVELAAQRLAAERRLAEAPGGR